MFLSIGLLFLVIFLHCWSNKDVWIEINQFENVLKYRYFVLFSEINHTIL